MECELECFAGAVYCEHGVDAAFWRWTAPDDWEASGAAQVRAVEAERAEEEVFADLAVAQWRGEAVDGKHARVGR